MKRRNYPNLSPPSRNPRPRPRRLTHPERRARFARRRTAAAEEEKAKAGGGPHPKGRNPPHRQGQRPADRQAPRAGYALRPPVEILARLGWDTLGGGPDRGGSAARQGNAGLPLQVGRRETQGPERAARRGPPQAADSRRQEHRGPRPALGGHAGHHAVPGVGPVGAGYPCPARAARHGRLPVQRHQWHREPAHRSVTAPPPRGTDNQDRPRPLRPSRYLPAVGPMP